MIFILCTNTSNDDNNATTNTLATNESTGTRRSVCLLPTE